MKAFDQTYADADFERQLASAKRGWMAQVPRPQQPDLEVAGLRLSVFTRILRVLTGRRD